MRNRFLNLQRILFLKSLILTLIFGFFSYKSPQFYFLVLTASFASILIFQFFILLSEFTIQIERIVWPLSYLLGFSFLFNLNKEWLFTYWKYQLVVYLFILLCIFSLRFIFSVNKWFLTLSFVNNTLYSVCLWLLILTNFEEEFYFNLAKGFTIYMILFAVLISISGRKTNNKIENSGVD